MNTALWATTNAIRAQLVIVQANTLGGANLANKWDEYIAALYPENGKVHAAMGY